MMKDWVWEYIKKASQEEISNIIKLYFQLMDDEGLEENELEEWFEDNYE